eukprot:Nk52_evm1s367 gene=Nk52_evmTU1s367
MADYADCPDPGLCEDAEFDNSKVWLGFLLTFGAGGATVIGAMLPFFCKSNSPVILAGALAMAAGVMLYISFAEILSVKTAGYFCCVVPDYYTSATSSTFFGGLLFTWCLNQLVHWIDSRAKRCCPDAEDRSNRVGRGGGNLEGLGVADNEDLDSVRTLSMSGADVEKVVKLDAAIDRAREASVQDVVEPGSENANSTSNSGDLSVETPRPEALSPVEIATGEDIELSFLHAPPPTHAEGQSVKNIEAMIDVEQQEEKTMREGLAKMGTLTAVAIALHNFPEGLATFVATLSDESLGAAIAVAIAIHNIPEGVCVAMPIYYASGSKWKAFAWASLSGVSEVFGAFLGWIILKDVFTPTVYAVLFGLVSGMMVYISLVELLPTAFRYDPEGKVVTLWLVIGMLVMALSLMAFEIFGA